jgi:hypothetical protein
MNTEAEAREVMAQHRQQEEHRRQSMLNRVQSETSNLEEGDLQEEGREAMVEHRQHEKHREDTMLKRAAAEVGLVDDRSHS